MALLAGATDVNGSDGDHVASILLQLDQTLAGGHRYYRSGERGFKVGACFAYKAIKMCGFSVYLNQRCLSV